MSTGCTAGCEPTLRNDYFVDRRLAKTDLMIGIPFLGNLQDQAMTETTGAIPANVDDPILHRVRPASVLLPQSETRISATAEARQSDAGVPIAWVPLAESWGGGLVDLTFPG